MSFFLVLIMLHFMFLLLNFLFTNIHGQFILLSSLLAKINSKYRNKNNADNKEESDRNIDCAKLSLSCPLDKQVKTSPWFEYPQYEALEGRRQASDCSALDSQTCEHLRRGLEKSVWPDTRNTCSLSTVFFYPLTCLRLLWLLLTLTDSVWTKQIDQ